MALKKSELSRSSLSLYTSRVGKFQSWLASVNVILLLSSVVLVIAGTIFRVYYYMHMLDFVSAEFQALPILLIVIGVLLFIFAALGFIFATIESINMLIGYAVVMGIISLFQITTLFLILDIRTLILKGDVSIHHNEAFDSYESENSTSRPYWDNMFQTLRCCGFKDHDDFLNTRRKDKMCVPHSCCIDIVPETGLCQSPRNVENICQTTTIQRWKMIHTHGCLTILDKMYKTELKGWLIYLASLEVIVILVEIIACALASAYVSQIRRREKKLAASFLNNPSNLDRDAAPFEQVELRDQQLHE